MSKERKHSASYVTLSQAGMPVVYAYDAGRVLYQVSHDHAGVLVYRTQDTPWGYVSGPQHRAIVRHFALRSQDVTDA